MRLKQGVRVVGIRAEMVLALTIADSVYTAHGHAMTITSVVDSKHSATSLHYAGSAADLRIRDLPEGVAPAIVTDLEDALGDDFDVILEGDHIHMEFQPRRLT